MVTRREFGKQLGGLAVSSILPISFGGSIFNSSSAQASPLAWFTTANQVLNAIALFSRQPNGLAAMLKANLELLDEVLNQLDLLNATIADLYTLVAGMPEQIASLVSKQYQIELMTELRAASARYLVLMKAYRSEPDVFSDELVKKDLRQIYNDVSSRRNTLEITPQGLGPETAAIIPACCALEIALMARLDYPSSVVVASLESYNNWIEKMLSDISGSIVDYQKKAMVKHDLTVKKYENNYMLKDLGLAEFKLGGTQQYFGTSECIFIGVWDVDSNPQSRSQYNDSLYTFGSSFMRHGKIVAQLEPGLGVKHLYYEPGDLMVRNRFNGGTLLGKEVPPGKTCHFIKCDWNQLKEMQRQPEAYYARLDIQQKVDSLISTKKDEVRLALSEMNLERSKIAFSSRSSIMLNTTKDKIRKHLEFLRG